MEKSDVKVKVVSQKGTCAWGHKKGDEWIITGASPAGLCLGALNAMTPFIFTLQHGGEYKWPPGSDTLQLCCPDPFNPVIFELTRIPGTTRRIG